MDPLEHGRNCYERRAWGDAYQALLCADQAAALQSDDLQRLATAAFLTGDREQDIAALGAVTVLDEPLPARDPGIGRTDLSPEQRVERKPERTSRGAHLVFRVSVETMQAFLQPLKLDVAPRDARREAARCRCAAQGGRLLGPAEVTG